MWFHSMKDLVRSDHHLYMGMSSIDQYIEEMMDNPLVKKSNNLLEKYFANHYSIN